MKLLKKIWDKTTEEKFVGRVATIGCTLITLFMVTTMPLPPAGILGMGMLNGCMIIVQIDSEFEEDD